LRALGLSDLFLHDIVLLARDMRFNRCHAQGQSIYRRPRRRTGTLFCNPCRNRAGRPVATSTRRTLLRTHGGTLAFEDAVGRSPLIRSAGYPSRAERILPSPRACASARDQGPRNRDWVRQRMSVITRCYWFASGALCLFVQGEAIRDSNG
jgi:hypothetical protein